MKKTFAYDFKACEFIMQGSNPKELKDRDALELWIEKCIHTQLGRYRIYNGTRYGANIEDLVIGNVYGRGFAESELRREVEEALTAHEDVQSMDTFEITPTAGDTMEVRFTLSTTYGEIEGAHSFGV